MVKKKSAGVGYLDISESQPWNIASDFATNKIAKPLITADSYEEIARFGSTDMRDDFIITPEQKNQARVFAMERLIYTLQLVINNSLFAIRKKELEEMKGYLTTLDKLEKMFKQCYNHSYNQKTKTKGIVIDEDKFSKVIDLLSKIKSDICNPLNKAQLIFTSTEEIDPDEYLRKMKEDMIMSG